MCSHLNKIQHLKLLWWYFPVRPCPRTVVAVVVATRDWREACARRWAWAANVGTVFGASRPYLTSFSLPASNRYSDCFHKDIAVVVAVILVVVDVPVPMGSWVSLLF